MVTISLKNKKPAFSGLQFSCIHFQPIGIRFFLFMYPFSTNRDKIFPFHAFPPLCPGSNRPLPSFFGSQKSIAGRGKPWDITIRLNGDRRKYFLRHPAAGYTLNLTWEIVNGEGPIHLKAAILALIYVKRHCST